MKPARRVIAGVLGGAIGVTLAALLGWPATAAAGDDPEVRRMIESLRPAAGRTRNLVIEPAAAPTAVPSTTSATSTTAPPSPARPAPTAPAGGLSLAIAFEPNSAQLRPESGATLGALVAAMISPELRQQRFVIEGHTDASGTAAQNLRLSRARAEQVRLYLVTLGVAAERLRAVGRGSSEPVNRGDPRSPENRRVRVLALP